LGGGRGKILRKKKPNVPDLHAGKKTHINIESICKRGRGKPDLKAKWTKAAQRMKAVAEGEENQTKKRAVSRAYVKNVQKKDIQKKHLAFIRSGRSE
jgi:transposase-like protein